jgi:hypothetical protein
MSFKISLSQVVPRAFRGRYEERPRGHQKQLIFRVWVVPISDRCLVENQLAAFE